MEPAINTEFWSKSEAKNQLQKQRKNPLKTEERREDARIVDVVNSKGIAVKRVEFNRVLIYQGPCSKKPPDETDVEPFVSMLTAW